jgi:hypothetical protein
MAGATDLELVERWRGHGAQHGHHLSELEMLDLSIGELKHFHGRGALQGVSPDGAPDPIHHYRGLQSVTGDIACHHPHVA